MAKHTQEPWHYEKDGNDVYVVDASRLVRVCTVHPTPDCKPRTQKANALLIAASPIMLGALHKAFQALCELVPLNPAYEAEVVMLKKVITKAQGEWP